MFDAEEIKARVEALGYRLDYGYYVYLLDLDEIEVKHGPIDKDQIEEYLDALDEEAKTISFEDEQQDKQLMGFLKKLIGDRNE